MDFFWTGVSSSRVERLMDDEGRVYVIFTISAICEAMNCLKQVSRDIWLSWKQQGLIERVKQKLCKPDLIYVKNFSVVNNLHLRSVIITSTEV